MSVLLIGDGCADGSTQGVSPPDAAAPAASVCDNGKPRKSCTMDGCNKGAVSNGRCRGHGGGRRCKAEGCTRSAQSSNDARCYAHGGGPRCRVRGCVKGAQSRGLCKAHVGGVRCELEGCLKSAIGNGICRRHGREVKCECPGGITNWTLGSGLCLKHSQDNQGTRQSTCGVRAMENDSSTHVDITTEEHEDIAMEVSRAEAISSDFVAVHCYVEGSSTVAENKGRCRSHSVKQRCNYPDGCRNIASMNSLFCLTHCNTLPPRISIGNHQTPCVELVTSHSGSNTTSSNPGSNERNSRLRTSTVKVTARQQELQARLYCDAILSTRTTELFAAM